MPSTTEALLDVNVLIASVFEDHMHHARARTFVEGLEHFYTCPTTQGGFLRFATRPWKDAEKVPQALGVGLLASLNRGEEHAVQAIHALDFGDYAMAVSLFKRAMSTLNGSLALLNAAAALNNATVNRWRTAALPPMFDLREIWLRVMAECREELERPSEEEN